MIRFIGRQLSESSPVNSEVKVLPASNPASIRIVEPLFPQSSGPADARNWLGGWIEIVPANLVTITPSCSRHVSVDAQSRLVEKFVSCDVPSATPAISAARCEMDLSPGRRMDPLTRRTGQIFMRRNLNPFFASLRLRGESSGEAKSRQRNILRNRRTIRRHQVSRKEAKTQRCNGQHPHSTRRRSGRARRAT